jgi:AcrR family transcriptional regulator
MAPSAGERTFPPSSDAPVDDTRQRILEAAAQVFGQEGYARATTRALADAAGVNEVTLFRHFGSKKNLFAAVVEQFGGPAVTAALEAQFTGDPRHDLQAFGRGLLRFLLERQDALRLMLCEATHFPEVRATLVQNPRQLRQMLARYFQTQMDQGQLRAHPPDVAAQAFMGMFFATAILEGILEDPASGLSTDELVAHFVDLFLVGITPRA